MRGFLALLTCSALLSACASYAPGDDKKGIELQAAGVPVLQAIRVYMDDNGRVPRTLQELVPKYLQALPVEPQINYDQKASRLDFTYTQEGSTGSQVSCHAVIGELDWICTGIYQQKQ